MEIGYILNGTYKITEEIGSGGGGVVYKAKHINLDTDVVVKKIRDEVQDKVNSRQEADVLKKIKHPHLPRVYDYIETDAGVFTVIDYIEGSSLDKLLKEQKKFDQKTVLRWAEQIADALAYLHKQNPPIIHSDIKPANIIILPNGDACLIDFNISVMMDDTDISSVGISMGYSSPEQYRDVYRYREALQKKRMSSSQATSFTSINKTEIIGASNTTSTETEIISQTEIIGNTEFAENAGISRNTDIIEQNTEIIRNTDIVEQNTEFDSFQIQFGNAHKDTTELWGNENQSKTSKTEMLGMQKPNEKISFKMSIDCRSDVYSLGCVLYHLLTGTVPSMRYRDIVPLEKLNPSIGEGLVVLVEKMMEFRPEDRYQDGRELLHAIQNCYKLDRRYQALRRRQGIVFGISTVFFIVGCVCIGLGIRQNKIKNEQDYRNQVEIYTNQAEAGYIQDALAGIRDLQVENPGDAYIFERELYYLFVNGQFENCIQQGMDTINVDSLEFKEDTAPEILGNIYYLVANSYYETKDYRNAQKLMEAALSLYQDNGLYYRDYAVILAKQGKLEQAEAFLQQAQQMGVGEDSIYYVEAEIHYLEDDLKTASEKFTKSINSTGDITLKRRGILSLANIYKDLGQFDSEISLLEKAMADSDGLNRLMYLEYLGEAYVNIARASYGENEEYYQKAIDMFTEIKESGYVTFQMLENLGNVLQESNRLEEAAEVFEQMINDYPNQYRSYMHMAFLEIDKQQQLANQNRSYKQAGQYYSLAKEKYADSDIDDAEMLLLESYIQDIKAGGWDI